MKRQRQRSATASAAQWCSLVCCFLLMASAAVSRNGRLFGHDLSSHTAAVSADAGSIEATDGAQDEPQDSVAALRRLCVTTPEEGVTLVNTTELCRDVIGFEGPTPLEIRIEGGIVTAITPLANDETPSFFESVETALLPQWVGLSAADAASLQVDAVSGSTYSSLAVTENVRRGLSLVVTEGGGGAAGWLSLLSWKMVVALLVVLAACIVPQLWKYRHYRLIQLLLNVGVLGFWCGSCVSYSMMTSALSNGLSLPSQLLPAALLVTAFVLPLFGRKGYYCAWVCPLGSLQELAGRCSRKKIALRAGTVRALSTAQLVLWGVLMVLLWSGVVVCWTDYELFAAFILGRAPVAVTVSAAAVVVLSLFVQRPYCRFVCPTGMLMKLSQNTK